MTRSLNMRDFDPHGLEPREERIMDAWDAGKSEAEIAAELRVSPTVVRAVTTNLGEGHPDRWALRVPSASAQLAAAIERLVA